jgi:ribosomal protein L12E/L44/L45/RPP1/RPP2
MKRKISTLIVFLILSIGSHAQETMTVVADGVGKNIESATQRAAEAALTQVVGSFIDSTKMIEKRKEIRDGVKKQTKKISSKISEYSQGMIQSIEVLEVSDDDGFTRVTAKVSVRIEDFKNYIKQTVFTEKKVRKGLLSKIKIKKKQSEKLSDLIVKKVLEPIMATEVITPVISGEIEEVTDLNIIDYMNKKVPGDGYIVKIPVKVTLNPDFIENFINILDETAVQKFEGGDISDAKNTKRVYAILIGDFLNSAVFGPSGDKTPYISLLDFSGGGGGYYSEKFSKTIGELSRGGVLVKNPEDIMMYVFPQRSVSNLCQATESTWMSLGGSTYGSDYIPNIKMLFVSKNGSILRKELIKYKGNSKNHSSSFSIILPELGEVSNISILNVNIKIKNRCMVLIDTESTYNIITKVSEDVLVRADKVRFSYVRPKLSKKNKCIKIKTFDYGPGAAAQAKASADAYASASADAYGSGLPLCQQHAP